MPNDKIFSFKTALPQNDKSGGKTKFAIIGDLGVFDHTKETLLSMGKNVDRIDCVVLVGDISYANGDHRIWDLFFDMIDEMELFTTKVSLCLWTDSHGFRQYKLHQYNFVATLYRSWKSRR